MNRKVCGFRKYSFSRIFTSNLFVVLNQFFLNLKAHHKITKMTIPETQAYIDKLANDFISIGESASEDVFRNAFAALDKEYAIWQWMSMCRASGRG